MREFLEAARRSSSGAIVARAILVDVVGRGPSEVGSTMWLNADGSTGGQVVLGGCLEGKVLQRLESLKASIEREVVAFELGDEDARALGLTCGARARIVVEGLDEHALQTFREVARAVEQGEQVIRRSIPGLGNVATAVASGRVVAGKPFDHELDHEAVQPVSVVESQPGVLLCEFFSPPRRLTIVGATRAAVELAIIGERLGLWVEIVDAREDRIADLPHGVRARAGTPSELIASAPPSDRDALVILVHDYKYEVPVLEAVLPGPCPYVGVLGGRKRAGSLRKLLMDRGVAAADIERLRMPVGLDIGAATPSELAVSIAGEIVSHFNKHPT